MVRQVVLVTRVNRGRLSISIHGSLAFTFRGRSPLNADGAEILVELGADLAPVLQSIFLRFLAASIWPWVRTSSRVKNSVLMNMKMSQMDVAKRLAVRHVMEYRLQLGDLRFKRILKLNVVGVPGIVGQVRRRSE